MSELKTKKTRASVPKFIAGIDDETQRQDAKTLVAMMQDITGEKAALWGPNIVGFGSYHYRYESGREGDWFLCGFSPRKQNTSIYIMSGLEGHVSLLEKLGKHKTGKCCLYIKRLADIHRPTLEKLIRRSVAHIRRTHKTEK